MRSIYKKYKIDFGNLNTVEDWQVKKNPEKEKD